MDYMVIRRLSDGRFTDKSGLGFTDQIVRATQYNNEEIAQAISKSCTFLGHPSEVMYVTCSISNVKG